MNITASIQQMILQACSAGEIREAAKKAGMRALAEDGWRLVAQGVTTPEEILRVTKDQSPDERAAAEARAGLVSHNSDSSNALVSL